MRGDEIADKLSKICKIFFFLIKVFTRFNNDEELSKFQENHILLGIRSSEY